MASGITRLNGAAFSLRRSILNPVCIHGEAIYYSPTIVIDLGVFSDHLFLRPRYHHYYFGDYYAASYYQGGFYASFSFQSSRYGYDPIYSHQRWEHRQDREWEHRVEASYQYRRDHEDRAAAAHLGRPEKYQSEHGGIQTEPRAEWPRPLTNWPREKTVPCDSSRWPRQKEQQLAQRGQEVQKSRDQRRTLEAKAVDAAARKPGAVFEPAKVTTSQIPDCGEAGQSVGRKSVSAQGAAGAQTRS